LFSKYTCCVAAESGFLLSYYTVVFVFPDIILQQKKKTIQNRLRNKTELASETVENMLQKQPFKHPTSPPLATYICMHVTLKTSLIPISSVGLFCIYHYFKEFYWIWATE